MSQLTFRLKPGELSGNSEVELVKQDQAVKETPGEGARCRRVHKLAARHDRARDTQLIRSPGSPAHPFDERLRSLGIPDFPNIHSLCQWVALCNVALPAVNPWLQEMHFLWGKIVWDWCLADELIMYGYVQQILHKRAALEGYNAPSRRHLAAAEVKKLPLLRKRLDTRSGPINDTTVISICGLALIAFKQGLMKSAETHMRAMQRIVAVRQLPKYIWMYCFWMDLPLSSFLHRAPSFAWHRPTDWIEEVSLTPYQRATARRSAMWNIRSFGMLPAHFLRQLHLMFEQLHEASIIRLTAPLSGIQQMINDETSPQSMPAPCHDTIDDITPACRSIEHAGIPSNGYQDSGMDAGKCPGTPIPINIPCNAGTRGRDRADRWQDPGRDITISIQWTRDALEPVHGP